MASWYAASTAESLVDGTRCTLFLLWSLHCPSPRMLEALPLAPLLSLLRGSTRRRDKLAALRCENKESRTASPLSYCAPRRLPFSPFLFPSLAVPPSPPPPAMLAFHSAFARRPPLCSAHGHVACPCSFVLRVTDSFFFVFASSFGEN